MDENYQLVSSLKSNLKSRFGLSLNISSFTSGTSTLEMINQDTSIVILGYYNAGDAGNELIKLIKIKNPSTSIILLSGIENVISAINSFKSGVTDFVLKGEDAQNRIISIIDNILTQNKKVLSV